MERRRPKTRGTAKGRNLNIEYFILNKASSLKQVNLSVFHHQIKSASGLKLTEIFENLAHNVRQIVFDFILCVCFLCVFKLLISFIHLITHSHFPFLPFSFKFFVSRKISFRKKTFHPIFFVSMRNRFVFRLQEMEELAISFENQKELKLVGDQSIRLVLSFLTFFPCSKSIIPHNPIFLNSY